MDSVADLPTVCGSAQSGESLSLPVFTCIVLIISLELLLAL